MSNSTDLYQAARRRVIAKTAYVWVISVLAVIALAQVGIWYLTTPGGYFWPIWPIIGAVIAAVVWGIALYGGSRAISEERIHAEAARMRGNR